MSTTPYADAASTYLSRGWAPLPLPAGEKQPPPSGWTGYAAPYPSGPDVAEWTEARGAGNVAIRMPETVLGLDVDAYADKPGAATYADAIGRLGPLPQTPVSTSRDDAVSGIRFFRVPAGRAWADVLGPGVEVIHHGHRYALAAPSVHPEGRAYRWVSPDWRPRQGPAVAELPELPAAWVAELDRGPVGDRQTVTAAPDAVVGAFLAELPAGAPCKVVDYALRRALAGLEVDVASRHDATKRDVMLLVRHGEQGHHGAAAALDTLEGAYAGALASSPRKGATDPQEWGRMLAGAVAKVRATPTAEADKGCCGTAADVPAYVATLDGDATAHDVQDAAHGVMGASWRPVDLAPYLDGSHTAPVPSVGALTGGAALFYAGAVNGIAGESGSGKTWTALAACVQQLDAGRVVVYVDYEADAGSMVARLLAMGADPAAVAERFVYLSPGERFDPVAADMLAGLLADRSPSLVVVDSTGEGLSLDGANPNADEDVAAWFRRLPTWVARRGPAALVLDHVTKADDGGLWPIGSQRKRAAVSGAQYMQRTVLPFAKGQPGRAKLICAKDRHGSYRMGQHVADLTVTPDGEAVAVELLAAAERSEHSTFRPTVLMERVSDYLADYPGATQYAVLEAVKGKRDGKIAALRTLVAEGYISTEPGPRSSTRHTLARPYREADDTGGTVGPANHAPDDRDRSRSLGEGNGGTVITPFPGERSGNGGGTVGEQDALRLLADELGAVDVGAETCGTCERPLDRDETAAGIGFCFGCVPDARELLGKVASAEGGGSA